MKLGKYSFGTGDRFGKQGKAQLRAIMRAVELGIEITPVWNKSNREHQIIGTRPESVRHEADQAVKALNYTKPYFVDADHINLQTAKGFIPSADFFTLDVAAEIGQEPEAHSLRQAHNYIQNLGVTHQIPGLKEEMVLDNPFVEESLRKYVQAIGVAGALYRQIKTAKGDLEFITEVSMDEVAEPQKPNELFIILALLAKEGVPVDTIAPKFSGRFNKGVDYVGDLDLFRVEFEADILVIKYAINLFDLSPDLKLSIHSGSDKFSIYPIMGELIRKYEVGIHVKTAGTTWLEEVIGLAMGDENSVNLVKEIYHNALKRQEELCGPYADVIDIDPEALPNDISTWTGSQIANALRHIPGHPEYNRTMRQLLHVSYKLAAERLDEFNQALDRNLDQVANQVEINIFERHLKSLFKH